MQSHHSAPRPGLTLIELVLVLIIMGLTSLVGVRQLHLYLDRLAARDAVRAAAGVVSRARDDAIALRVPVIVRIDTAAAVVELRSQDSAYGRASLRDAHGVSLRASRDSITFGPRGMGHGVANLTLVARRGHAAETLVVSRLGRVRY